MKDRIKLLRTQLLKERDGRKYTQKDFADRLGLSENYVWQMEKGDRNPSDRTIEDICEKFGVDRVWLESGVGEPFIPVGREKELASIFGSVLSEQPTIKNAFLSAVAQLPEELFPVFVKAWIEAAEEMKKSLEQQ